MDQNKIGNLIKELRKKNNLTHNTILDLGCSTGEQIQELKNYLHQNY